MTGTPAKNAQNDLGQQMGAVLQVAPFFATLCKCRAAAWAFATVATTLVHTVS